MWARRHLYDNQLAERLEVIDPMQYQSPEQLRQHVPDVIEDRLVESPFVPSAAPGHEFFFLTSKMVILDTGMRARTPGELGVRVSRIATGSIYCHFIEGRRRPPPMADDFSAWLAGRGPGYERCRASIAEIDSALVRFELHRTPPILLRVSRFDRFKDRVGVIRAYRQVKTHGPVQVVLAGGNASYDPEETAVLEEVRDATQIDPDVRVLLLPADSHREINALQRGATIVLQKSLREGFGLTVTEALWRERPVIGGDTGGITLQIVSCHTGFLVNTPEGAAFRIRHLLSRPAMIAEMGKTGEKFVRENFQLTRHLREYLTLMLSLRHGAGEPLVLA